MHECLLLSVHRMKTSLVILAIVAIVALSEARPPRGFRGRQGGRGRGPRGPGGILKRACSIELTNGTTITKDCYTANGLFECQPVDMSLFPRPLRNINAISLCLPVSWIF